MLGLGNSLTAKRYSSATWSPSNLGSKLKAWFKNDTDILEGTSDPAENNDNVTQWSDQSGNDNHLTAPNNFFQYDSSTGGIISAGSSNDKMHLTNQLTLSGQFALYMRVSFSSISSGAHDLFFYDKDSSSSDFFRIQSTTEVRGKISNGVVRKFTQPTQSLDTFFNFGIERDSDNDLLAFRDNSALSATTAVTDTGTLDIDSIGGNFDGTIKEVIICNSSLSSSERTELQAYLANI
tara:strand:+ start:261 stop:968 length:708 start_codon:yes stop_codon:yes gene_type:complete